MHTAVAKTLAFQRVITRLFTIVTPTDSSLSKFPYEVCQLNHDTLKLPDEISCYQVGQCLELFLAAWESLVVP